MKRVHREPGEISAHSCDTTVPWDCQEKKTTCGADSNVSTALRFKTAISCREILKLSFNLRPVVGSTELLRSTELIFLIEVTKSRCETKISVN